MAHSLATETTYKTVSHDREGSIHTPTPVVTPIGSVTPTVQYSSAYNFICYRNKPLLVTNTGILGSLKQPNTVKTQ